jgi:zinc transporter, ZIP family
MLAAVSFDLVAEANDLPFWQFGLQMLIGATVFLLGDRLVERRFGHEGTGAAMGIVVGSAVDGVPESLIFGVQLATGLPVSASFLAAVLVSNVPEHGDGEGVAAFAAGGLLAMLTDSLIPFAYEHGGELAGVGTVLGFCLALISS